MIGEPIDLNVENKSQIQAAAKMYRKLADDLDRLVDGWRPDHAWLAKQPLLADARPSARPVAALEGVVAFKPWYGEAREIVSPPVIAISDSGGFARVLSGFWRISRRPE